MKKRKYPKQELSLFNNNSLEVKRVNNKNREEE